MSEHKQSFWTHYVFSTDHKMIGKQFLLTGLFFMVIGGILAMVIRWQWAWPFDEDKKIPVLSTVMFAKEKPVTDPATGQMVTHPPPRPPVI